MVEKSMVVRAPIEVARFEELAAQTKKLNEFYTSLMQEGTDYGKIPGTDKPTLLKSGAELLRLWAGLTPKLHINREGTDLERGILNYEVKCSLYRDDKLIGEGVGSCNSLESKYRYRWVFPSQLPEGTDTQKLATRTIKTKYSDKAKQYRLENDNPQDLANTILKMAKKRAFVDAILTVTGASRIFTQDVEDMDLGHREVLESPVQKPPATKKPKEVVEKASEPKEVAVDEPEVPVARDPATIKNLGELFMACFKDFGLDRSACLKELSVNEVSEITDSPAECYQKIALTRS